MASELRVDRISPVDGIAAVTQSLGGNAGGGIVQIRHSNTKGLTFASAESPSNTFVATGITGIITPIRSDNKILIIANPSVMCYRSGSNDANGSIKIMRSISGGSYTECSPIQIGTQVGYYDYGGNGLLCYNNISLIGVDEPSTTSEVTYQFYIKRINGNGIRMGYQLNADIGSNSFITMMEIAG
tara:strand:+ start:277 stop:831 length:555 start_codon:yes stop_codon:yes gene_type:complete